MDSSCTQRVVRARDEAYRYVDDKVKKATAALREQVATLTAERDGARLERDDSIRTVSTLVADVERLTKDLAAEKTHATNVFIALDKAGADNARLLAAIETLTVDIGTMVRWWLIHMPRNTVQPSRDLVNAIVAKYATDIPADVAFVAALLAERESALRGQVATLREERGRHWRKVEDGEAPDGCPNATCGACHECVRILTIERDQLRDERDGLRADVERLTTRCGAFEDALKDAHADVARLTEERNKAAWKSMERLDQINEVTTDNARHLAAIETLRKRAQLAVDELLDGPIAQMLAKGLNDTADYAKKADEVES